MDQVTELLRSANLPFPPSELPLEQYFMDGYFHCNLGK